MSSLLVFEEFELDVSRFELRQRGQRVPAQPKVLKLLFHLVAQRHRSVPEGELLQALWPGEKVGPASVRRAVRGARNALGERGDGESSIRTVRGHGYQFVLPVREVGPPAARRDSEPASSTRSSGIQLQVSEALPPVAQAEGVADTFVGREPALATVDAALAEVVSGHGRSLLFTGEPGIGKTRILHELARRAAALGALTWFGRCLEVDGAPAFWPVIQIVRESAKDFHAADLRELMGAGAADIAQAIPELRQWLPGLPQAEQIDSVAARFRFFDSMALFLRRAAELLPIVLLVDDLQRADQPTLRLLAFLAHELERSRVLLVGATRPAVEQCGDGADPRCGLAHGVAIRNVELPGLTLSEVGHYLRLRLGLPAPAAVIERLHEQTAGNPLFLEQILHGAVADAAHGESCWDRLVRPVQRQGLRAAIDRHLEILSEPCRVMLRTAAVLGRDFSAGLLTQIAGGCSDAVAAQLAEAIAAGILQPVGDSPGQHRFAHALIRDAMYEQLPVAERARLHGRAGLALEALGAAASDALLPKLAEHFALGAPADPGRVLQYTLRAALAAKQRLAYEEAALHLDRALEVLERTPADASKRLQLLLDKGEALCSAGQASAARPCLLHAAGIARELGASQELAAAAALIARWPETGTVDPVQVSLLREALAALPADDGKRPWLQALLAKSLMYARDPAPCAQIALAARSTARTLGESRLRTEALWACHEALAAPDHWGERLSISEELAQIGHEQGDHHSLLRAATAQVWNCVELGDMAGADTALRSLETLADHVREPFSRWHARAYRAMRAMVHGQLEQAERLAGEARELGTPIAEASAYHVFCAQMNGIYRLQNRVLEAEAIVRDISLRHPGLAGWRAVLACIEADMGHKQRARAVLEQLMERELDSLRRDPFVLSAFAPAADLCAEVGDAELARVLYDAILPYENHHGNVSIGIATHGPMARHLGVLAIRIGDLALAQRHLQCAIAAAEAMPSPPFVALSCIACARVVLWDGRSGGRERAAELLGRALAAAKACGLWALARRCRELADGVALRLPPVRLSEGG